MIVLNAMLASGMGGMEQMSVTYIKALIQNGHEVHALYMAALSTRIAGFGRARAFDEKPFCFESFECAENSPVTASN